MLAYLIAAGLAAFYCGPTYLVQKLVLYKTSSWLPSFLMFTEKKEWVHAILNNLDTADALKLRAQVELNIEEIIIWVSSTWVYVSGLMHQLDYSPVI